MNILKDKGMSRSLIHTWTFSYLTLEKYFRKARFKVPRKDSCSISIFGNTRENYLSKTLGSLIILSNIGTTHNLK